MTQEATGGNPKLKPIIGCDGCEQLDGPDSDRGYLPANQRVGGSEASEYTRFLVKWPLPALPDGAEQWSDPEQAVFCLGCEESAKYDGAKLLSLPDPEPDHTVGIFVMTRDEPDVMTNDGREQVARQMLTEWRLAENNHEARAEGLLLEILELMGVDL